ncbi:MAG: trans-acting enoyl reductase family protein [Polyangiales bacterium]
MTPTPHSARTHDVVLWGATGFTGRLVAEYLASHYGVGRDLRWALGGRNRKKLEAVRDGLLTVDPRASELPLLVGDGDDPSFLGGLAGSTRVVCTTVGPYALHGHPLVAACVEHGTAYCDLTGETQFVRQVIDRHHARAKETGARIVNCCGFDSIPFDLGVLMVQDAMRARHGVRCVEVKSFAGEMKGGVSGGTASSALNAVAEATSDKAVRRILGDPDALDPDLRARGERGPDAGDQRGVRFDRDLGRWTGPFVMAAINTRVVRRSHALLGYPWGKDFRYSEATSFGPGPRGWMSAAAMTAGIGAFVGVAAISPLRGLLRRALPAAGEGPSKEARDAGFFQVRIVGIGEARDGAPPPKLLGIVAGTSDPGYGETAKMLGESAVCLAKDELPTAGGVLTPASAMGPKLLARLREAGMTFEVDELAARR